MVTNVHKSSIRKAKAKEPPGEALCVKSLASSPHLLIPWYLMGAYAYQVLDETLISDGLYDRICKRIELEWDALEHAHKHVIDHAALVTGTSSYLSVAADYPAIVRDACHLILERGPQLAERGHAHAL